MYDSLTEQLKAAKADCRRELERHQANIKRERENVTQAENNLGEVDVALRLLDAQPDVQKALNAVHKALGHL